MALSTFNSIIYVALGFLAIFIHRKFGARPYRCFPLPPGPRKRFIVGNLFDRPHTLEWEVYQKWSQEFDSDIIHLDLAGHSIIVLNSTEVAEDLLEKRSNMYSSRPSFIMANELLGWDFNFALMPYGDTWRKCRRIFHQEFHSVASRRFRSIETLATHDLLLRILDKPDDLMKHLRHMAGKIILSITYGIDVLSDNDPYISLAEEAIHYLVQSVIPGAFIVDSLPILKHLPAWVPGAGFKRTAKEWRRGVTAFKELPFSAAKSDFLAGISNSSFVSHCLRHLEGKEHQSAWEEIVKYAAGSIYAAGSDTTVSLLGTFFLAMMENPTVQAKAQAELDTVIGQERLPNFDDQPRLPYTTAIVKESMRWRNVTPIGVPHHVTADDVYRGYHIPKDSTVIANLWSMLHDEGTYPNSSEFNPDRFIKDGELNPDVKDPATIAFGFGRRICPGRYMAQDSVWIAIATLLAALNIQKATDLDGNTIELSHEYRSALVYMPLPFKCSIKPRSKHAEALLRTTADIAV